MREEIDRPWTAEDDEKLEVQIRTALGWAFIAEDHGRTLEAVQQRAKLLGFHVEQNSDEAGEVA